MMEKITEVGIDQLEGQPTILKIRVSSGEVTEFEVKEKTLLDLLDADDLTDDQIARIVNADVKGIDTSLSDQALQEVITNNYEEIYEDYIHFDGLPEYIDNAMDERDLETEKLIGNLEQEFTGEIEELNDDIKDLQKILVELGESKHIKYRDKISLPEVLSKDPCVEGILFFNRVFGTSFEVTTDNVKKLRRLSPEYYSWAQGQFLYESNEVQDFLPYI